MSFAQLNKKCAILTKLSYAMTSKEVQLSSFELNYD